MLIFFPPSGLGSRLPLVLASGVSARSEELRHWSGGVFLPGEELRLSNSPRAPSTKPVYFLLNENSLQACTNLIFAASTQASLAARALFPASPASRIIESRTHQQDGRRRALLSRITFHLLSETEIRVFTVWKLWPTKLNFFFFVVVVCFYTVAFCSLQKMSQINFAKKQFPSPGNITSFFKGAVATTEMTPAYSVLFHSATLEIPSHVFQSWDLTSRPADQKKC